MDLAVWTNSLWIKQGLSYSFVSRIQLYNFDWDVSVERFLLNTKALLRDKSCSVRSSFVSNRTICVSEI